MQSKQLGGSLRQRYESLRSQLLDPKCFPTTNSLLNLPAFVRDNEAMYLRLAQELRDLRSCTIRRAEPAQSKIVTTSPFHLNSSISVDTNRQEDRLKELRLTNEELRSSLARLREEKARRKREEAPMLREREAVVSQKKEAVEKAVELGKLLQRARESEDLLEMYDLKCRECEALRKVNNATSDEIRAAIVEMNKVGGREENPNGFIVQLKIE